jgi:hypothetical protein
MLKAFRQVRMWLKKSMPTPTSRLLILNDLVLAVASSVHASCRVFVISQQFSTRGNRSTVTLGALPLATASTNDDSAKARSQKLTSVVIGVNAACGGQLSENTGD